jgi:iron complex outermembrane receptor protein
VSAYRYSASNLIQLDLITPDDFFSDFAFFNRGTVEAKGVEFEGEVRSKTGFQALGSFAFQRAVDDADERLTNSPRGIAKLRLSAPGPIAGTTGAFEVQHLSSRRTLAGDNVSAVTIAHATVTAQINSALEVVATVRNLFDQTYFDPASDEHLADKIEQNGRTARIGLRWNLWTRKP